MKTHIVLKCWLMACLVALGLPVAGFGQAKVWTGGGDRVSWTNAANWSGGSIPGATHDVFITNGLGTSVTCSGTDITIKSLHCSRSLLLSNIDMVLTEGESSISAALTVAADASLAVEGVGTSLSASGNPTVVAGDLYAREGAVLQFPNLISNTNAAYIAYWQAQGSGSRIEMPALTNLAVAASSRLYLQAYEGGQIDLHQLLTRTNALWVDARNPDSQIDLSGLAGRYTPRGGFDFELYAQDGASILVPNLTQLDNATVSLVDGGIVNVDQLNLITNVELRVDATSPTFTALTNVDGSSIRVYNGGVVRLPGVTRAVMAPYLTYWEATGTGSQIDASSLTQLAVATSSRLYLQAYDGGQIDLHQLTTKTNALWVDARDAGSVINLSALTGRYMARGGFDLSLYAEAGGSILVPNLTQLDNATLSLVNSGQVSIAQINLLTNVDLTVDATLPAFTSLTNVDDTSIRVRNGGSVQLSKVTRAAMKAYITYWQAQGAGSWLDASSLTNLTVASSSRLYLQAYEGGRIDLPNVTTKTNALWVDAQDSGSVVNLSGLSGRYSARGGFDLSLAARDGASILIPNLTQFDNATISFVNTGSISCAQWTLLTNVQLTVDAALPNLNAVTNIDDTTIKALNGGVARLTNVTRATMNAYITYWQAQATNSLVDVSRVTNLSVATSGRLYLQAYDGGAVDLQRLTTKTNALWVDARDPGSSVNLTGLVGTYASRANFEFQLVARDGAAILIPNISQLDHATVNILNTGVVNTAQWTLLTNVDLTVQSATPNFSSLTNLQETSLYANDYGVLNLTNVSRAVLNQYISYWIADGPGAQINLPKLSSVMVDDESRLFLQAKNGGQVDMHTLKSLSTGAVQVLADGTGSVIDLRGVTAFISSGSFPASLTAQNGGVILLTEEAFLLSNVAINIPAGNPVLPPTLIPSKTVTLYGRPWHSYWIEKRDSRLASNPWVFAARVPLTTSFQDFAPAPPLDTDLRVFEFYANPAIVDMIWGSNKQAQMVVYGAPNVSVSVLTTTNLQTGGAWQPWTTLALTNSFRILSPAAAPEARRFFKGGSY